MPDVTNKLSERYGDITPLSISRGEIHNYLGMVFDYTTSHEVKNTMYQYIDGLLDNVPKLYWKGIGMETSASENLYGVQNSESKECEMLTDDEREQYHSLTTQLIYISKRGRADPQTSIVFHCTRIKKPDQDDQKKLGRTVRYLKDTRYLPMILSID